MLLKRCYDFENAVHHFEFAVTALYHSEER